MYGRCHSGEKGMGQNWKPNRCGSHHAAQERVGTHRCGCRSESFQSSASRKAWLEERKAHLQSRLDEINAELAETDKEELA